MRKTARYILDESTKLTTKAKAIKLSKGTKWNLDKLYQDYRDSNCSLSVDGVGDDRILTITKENGETLSFDVNDNIVYEQGEELKEYINLTKRNILQEYALLDEKKKIKKNILKRTAEKHKKTDTEHAMGWFKGSHPKGATLNTNAGNVEKNVEFFNHAMGNTTSTADGGVGAVASVSNGGGIGEELDHNEKQGKVIYKGFTIEHFPITWVYKNKEETSVDNYVILSSYYLHSNPQKEKSYLPLYCEDEKGNDVNFHTLDAAREYIDKYIITKKGKVVIKHGNEVHYELLDRVSDINESLEDTEEIKTEEEKVEDIGITKMISDLIKDEWEAIDGYKSAISTLTSIEANPEIVEVLQNISSEEMAHIGELEHCMSLVSPEVSEIESGKDEAKETIDDSFSEQ